MVTTCVSLSLSLSLFRVDCSTNWTFGRFGGSVILSSREERDSTTTRPLTSRSRFMTRPWPSTILVWPQGHRRLDGRTCYRRSPVHPCVRFRSVSRIISHPLFAHACVCVQHTHAHPVTRCRGKKNEPKPKPLTRLVCACMAGAVKRRRPEERFFFFWVCVCPRHCPIVGFVVVVVV